MLGAAGTGRQPVAVGGARARHRVRATAHRQTCRGWPAPGAHRRVRQRIFARAAAVGVARSHRRAAPSRTQRRSGRGIAPLSQHLFRLRGCSAVGLGSGRPRREAISANIPGFCASELVMKKPVTVTITGAAGNIGYALAFRVASGQMLGPEQPINLNLLEIPAAAAAVQGVVMELNDCAFRTLNKVTATSDATVAFKDCEFAMLVGARPRGPGMERKDLLLENAKIFSAQGKALDAVASRDVRVLVVGNPANTNSLIAQRNAPSLAPNRFTAMTRLDHNRGLAQLTEKTGAPLADVKKIIIWGNHSATQYPDLHHATVAGKPALSLVEAGWFKDTYIPTVQQRGAAIIKARGTSSAASAAAALDHVHDWMLGTPAGDWVSMAVPSDGSYGIPEGVIYSYPVTCKQGEYSIVQGLSINDFSREKMQATHRELLEERDGVKDLL